MKKFILMAAVGLLVSLGVNAQKQGYVNTSELLRSLPSLEKAQKDLQTYAKPFEEAFNTMKKDYETKVTAFQRDQKTLSEAIRDVKISEIQDLEQRMGKYQQDTEEKLSKKENELMAPIIQSINKAITDYGTANGYDYIYNSETILFAKESDNLTNALITKMGGKPVPKTSIGTAAPAAGK